MPTLTTPTNWLIFLSKARRRKDASHWYPTVFLHATLTRSLPIPYLRGYHVLDLVRFIVFAVLNVIFSLNDNEYTTDYKLYGWLTIANGGLALLLAARSNLFSVVLRIPAPVLLQYHRWIGLATVAHATVHIGFNVMHFVSTEQIASNLESPRIRVGLMAWLCLALIFLTALPVVRRRFFEVFYYTHFLFFVFMVGALYHTTNGPEFLLPGFSLWVVDRAIRFAYNFRTITVEDVAYFEGGLTKLQLSGVRAAKAGQMVWVQIVGVSFANWHPFTVARASADSTSGDASKITTTLAIRALGGYTSAAQKLAEKEDTQAPLRVRIDGPYGVGRFNWQDERLVVLIAGGIGITPGLSIASSLITGMRKLAKASHEGPVQQIHLLWAVKEASHIAWFANELRTLHELARRPESRVSFQVTIHVTNGATAPSASDSVELRQIKTAEGVEPWTLERGRPDIRSWLFAIRELAPNVDAAVNVCGPASLVLEVRRASVLASCVRGLFRVEEESFEL